MTRTMTLPNTRKNERSSIAVDQKKCTDCKQTEKTAKCQIAVEAKNDLCVSCVVVFSPPSRKLVYSLLWILASLESRTDN